MGGALCIWWFGIRQNDPYPEPAQTQPEPVRTQPEPARIQPEPARTQPPKLQMKVVKSTHGMRMSAIEPENGVPLEEWNKQNGCQTVEPTKEQVHISGKPGFQATMVTEYHNSCTKQPVKPSTCTLGKDDKPCPEAWRNGSEWDFGESNPSLTVTSKPVGW